MTDIFRMSQDCQSSTEENKNRKSAVEKSGIRENYKTKSLNRKIWKKPSISITEDKRKLLFDTDEEDFVEDDVKNL